MVRYSDRTMIGKRGFTDEEKEKGIVLVFNDMNHKNLQWTEEGSIVATMAFGINNRPENCFIHYDDIVALYSPEARVQFDRWDMWEDYPKKSEGPGKLKKERSPNGKIVSLDNFRK
ncbi:MAG: hypothetical protein AB1638_09495 [Nitrospirota bacterium]